MNACKHGLASEAAILPGEDPAEYDARLEEWLDHYQPESPAERLLVERAVRASWMLDRCTRAEDAAVATRARHAADDFRRADREQAESIGRRLIEDDVNYHCHVDSRSQVAAELIERRRRDDPPILALTLNSFAAGADWLIARWRELGATLDEIGLWHPTEAHRAIRLLGKRPVDLFDDPIVRLIVFAAHDADPRALSLIAQVQNIFGQTHNRPEEFDRLQLIAGEAMTPEAGLAVLRGLVASEIARLEEEKRTRLDPLERLDGAAATARAAFDDSESGALRHRYEASRERALHRALADLARSIKDNPRVAPGPIVGEATSPEKETSSGMASFRQETPCDDEATPETASEPCHAASEVVGWVATQHVDLGQARRPGVDRDDSGPNLRDATGSEVGPFDSVRVDQGIPGPCREDRTA